jgi:hypothetical protein
MWNEIIIYTIKDLSTSLYAAIMASLFRRAFHRSIRTKYTAIPFCRHDNFFAVSTFIKKYTAIFRHSFFFAETTERAGNDG